MRAIRHTDTLVDCDGVQVFKGRGSDGGHYVGVMIDSSGRADRYLVTSVSSERLRRVRAGAIDLRTLFLEAGLDEWRLTDVADGFQAPLTPVRPETPGDYIDFLPDEGFFLRDSPAG